MKSHWITYRGKQILYCDYSGYTLRDFDALKAEMDAAVAVLVEQPEGSCLALTDVRRSVASPAVVALIKDAAIVTAKHVRKQAVLGITGMKKVLFDAVIRVSKQPARAFGDLEEEEAKQWLVEEEVGRRRRAGPPK